MIISQADYERINLRAEWALLRHRFVEADRQAQDLRRYLVLYAVITDFVNRAEIDLYLARDFPDLFQEIETWRGQAVSLDH